MVYRGKLSKACLPCRKRKLVCDLKVEGCSQCFRAKIICHGYRNTEALRVTDESIAVQRKALGKVLKSSSKSQSLSRVIAPAIIIHHVDQLQMPQPIIIPIRIQAKDIFYYNYVVGSLKPFDFLQQFYSPTSKDEHLTASLDAVALVHLNYQRQSPSAQSEGRARYVTALRLLNNAIHDPVLAKEDSTLLAILLLDLYEKITTKEPHYEGAWAAHLQGALALVKARGDQQYVDPVGLRILVRLTTNEIISCVASHRPIAPEIVALRKVIGVNMSGSVDPKSRESDLMVELAKLRYEIEEGNVPDNEATLALKSLDQRFLALSRDVWPSWQYKQVFVKEKSPHHWESYHHVYPHEQIGQMWNVLRLTRILLSEQILSRCSAQGETRSSDTQVLCQQATETISEMVCGICATVPQYIGDLSEKRLQDLASLAEGLPPSLTQFTSPRQPSSPNPTHHLPCYRLIFPLYIAAQTPLAPPALRIWVVERLRFMADYHAIENAARVADIIELGNFGDPWLLYAMLGSYAFVC